MPVGARVIADSVTVSGDRLTTLEVVCHRFILAEFNTHRAFSRNSASSRAIPIKKQLQKVMEDPAIPVEWGSNQKGMQAGPPFTDEEAEPLLEKWLEARDNAVRLTEQLNNWGLHKQVANRLLEPFMWHTIVVSATDWDGFWHQRCSPLAQPEIRVAAEAMKEAYDASTPNIFLDQGGWHMPYLRSEDFAQAPLQDLKRISAARCARVSYLTQNGERDLQEDLNLYYRLVEADPPHASPLEHVATPGYGKGNFRGWTQLRHLVEAGFK